MNWQVHQAHPEESLQVREQVCRDLQINELTISVSDMKGKFIKPTLKKVSKYENKFAKLQEKAAKFAFANQLKAK